MHIPRKTFQSPLPHIAYTIWKTILRNLYYGQCLNIVLMAYGMLYDPNGKDIMVPMENTLIIYNPNKKGMILWKIVFRSGNRHGNKIQDTV